MEQAQAAKRENTADYGLRAERHNQVGETLPMDLPRCPTHPKYQMAIRSTTHMSPEQRWCGVWYDCQACSQSVLFKSVDLDAHLRSFAS